MYIDEYEINEDTLAIVQENKNVSKIIEKKNIYYINMDTTKIIDYSCKYFGSSYQGRCYGAKSVLGSNYKLPILIDEMRNILFFPTSSPRLKNCMWISLNNIEYYEKNETYTNIIFKNSINLKVDISYGSFQNQVYRSYYLINKLKNRRNIAK